MYCPIYKGQCPNDCVFHLGVGENCLIVNALQAFIKDKHRINQEQTKARNDKYMKYLNEMYDICLSAVHNSKENDGYNVSLCGKDRIDMLRRASSAHSLKNYQETIQESDEDFIIPI